MATVRETTFGIRLTKAEKELLDRKARSMGLSLANYMRMAAITYHTEQVNKQCQPVN